MAIINMEQEHDSSCKVQIDDGLNTTTCNQVALATGAVDAVCVDWIDLGIQDTPWGKKHQCRVVFETDMKNEKGYPVTISRTFTKSFHELSVLRPFLKSWRGADLSDEELQGTVKLDKTVGKGAVIKYQDTVSKNGRAYLKLLEIAPGKGVKPSGTYRRFEPKNN